MRVRNNPYAIDEIKKCDKYIQTEQKLQEILKKAENNKKKIYVEIGMGKGDFISKKSYEDKENIYIGIEVCLPILALAVKKISKYEEKNATLENLYLMSCDASTISDFFKMHQIEKIYLNFSDPWPKKKHTKRRLTYSTFLEEYKKVLKENGIIEFKTDNRELFEYSLVSMQNFGMSFLEVYLDLHKTDIPNILTEYEEKFCLQGPIYKLVTKIN
ncbi:MAG: tRNA (guanosine(46)-N7)-methyltransferase TrmB [Clostridia bacterium]